MIYTLGYEALTPQRLREIALALDAVVLDCRFKPVSRIPGFGCRQLEKLMQPQAGEDRANDDQGRYVRMGHMLGGRGHTTPSGIAGLQPFADDLANCVLLCREEHPADCHRHTAIAGPHYPGAMHVYRDRVFAAADLARVEAGELTYDDLGSVSFTEWLEILRETGG